ncbi:LysR family transcriptional regulator [Kineosporia succinea]|uniref:DNA-binding transcriptional LysR family regulator n=1 Tax=Kineosporia succinea TaxID=84632 RepID=A0ABT9PBR1_9ACTN|nr:LysR family transcriptional regulator [Kineosporia succinea]MDP9830137.1 DNA-binding transcriptional LysR family regulator [Kineosporia succinea]
MDLNLLTALDALLSEGSVSAAAERSRVSVPSMSRTLARLRRVTGDELLVRSGRGMTLTPRALALRDGIGPVLQQARDLLTPAPELDLARLERTFTLRWHESLVTALGPALVARVREAAPGARLRFLAEPAADTDDVRHTRIDLLAGSSVPALPDLNSVLLGHDELVVVMRAGHPLAAKNLTLQRYARADHLSVSRRGRLRDPVDDVLEKHGVTRDVTVAVPGSAAALDLVATTDLLAVVPRRVTASSVIARGLVTRPAPVALPPVPLRLYWHRRHDDDQPHAWLRGLVVAVSAPRSERPEK